MTEKDNDMIRRGDALKTVDEELRRYGFSAPEGRRYDMQKAIAALPAAPVGHYTRTGVMDKDGREICVGDRIMIDLSSPNTKREYWRPEYEVVFKPPFFTIRHVGGDKPSDTADFYWRVPQPSSTEKIITLSIAALDLTPVPDAAAIREATARLQKLAYWLDTDAEVLADMDQRDLSDHQHIQAEVSAILALIGKEGK